MFFKYATIAIPANTPLRRTRDWSPTSFPIPLRVRARIPCCKDGRVKGAREGWVFNEAGIALQLEQNQEPQVHVTDVEVRRLS